MELYSPSYSFSDKTILILGGSCGIGIETAKLLIKTGAKLILVSRNITKFSPCREFVDTYKDTVLIDADVRDISGLKDKLSDYFCRIDGIVFCVYPRGVAHNDDKSVNLLSVKRFKKITQEDFQDAMLGGCISFVEIVKEISYAKPKSKQLKVVAISSLASSVIGKNIYPYCCVKAALEAAVRAMAAELVNKNVILNCVRPNAISSDYFENTFGDLADDIKKKLLESKPLGLIPSSNIAKTILFLLSDSSNYMTGKSIDINAGENI